MQLAETAVPRAHARLRRIDLRVVTGLVLMAVAIAGGTSLIRAAQERTPVLLVAGSIQPGEVITAEHLRVAEVSLAAGVDHLPASAREQVVGRVAAEPLWEGKVLSSASVSEAPPLPAGAVAFTVLLPAESALGGDVRSGDRVAVVASPSREAGGEGAGATILLPEVPVLSVHAASSAEGQGLLVTLTLRLEEARALAEARSVGRIDLALLPGGAG